MGRWMIPCAFSVGAHVVVLGVLSDIRPAEAVARSTVAMRLEQPPPKPEPPRLEPPKPEPPRLVPVRVAPKTLPKVEAPAEPQSPPVPEARVEEAAAALPGPAEPQAGTGPAAGTAPMLGAPQGTAVKPPPPDVPVVDHARAKSDLAGYHRQIYAQMMAERRYPPAARRLGLEGRVVIAVRIDRRGRLVGKPRLVESSDQEILDAEAMRLATLRDFPPLPATYLENDVELMIPIRFRLTD